MKVEELLRTLSDVEYYLLSATGKAIENGYVTEYNHRANDFSFTNYDDYDVVKISTVQDKDILFITIK